MARSILRKCEGALIALVLVAGCGKKGGGGEGKYAKSEWKTEQHELEGVKISVEVPTAVPFNSENMLGKQWAGVPGSGGPRLSIDVNSETYADVDAFAAQVEDPKRADMEVLGKEAKDGRLRFAYAVKGDSHMEVAVWVPISDSKGVECIAHYYAGFDRDKGEGKKIEKRDEILAFLDRFCAGVKIVP